MKQFLQIKNSAFHTKGDSGIRKILKLIFHSKFFRIIRNTIGFRPPVFMYDYETEYLASDLFIWRTDKDFQTVFKSSDILKKTPKLLEPVTWAYERRLNQFGNDARGVFWQNKEYQFKRFEILSRIFDPEHNDQDIAIHDFGCGYGALFDYLTDKSIMTNAHYIGTDMSSQMITAARQKTNDPRAKFRCDMEAVDITDYTLVSGTFNMHLGQNEEEWEAYIKDNLVQLWS